MRIIYIKLFHHEYTFQNMLHRINICSCRLWTAVVTAEVAEFLAAMWGIQAESPAPDSRLGLIPTVAVMETEPVGVCPLCLFLSVT